MDGGSEGGLIGWLIDGAAAAIAGAAAGWCAFVVVSPIAGAVAGVAVLGAILLVLRAIKPEPRRYSLPVFTLVSWEEAKEFTHAEPDVLKLTELEPLVLDDVIEPPSSDSRVVQLFARQPLPTAGELKARIDAHLERQPRRLIPPEGGEVVPLPVDASAALRAAIADLRRSLG